MIFKWSFRVTPLKWLHSDGDDGEPKSQSNEKDTVGKPQVIKGEEADEDIGKPQAIEGK